MLFSPCYWQHFLMLPLRLCTICHWRALTLYCCILTIQDCLLSPKRTLPVSSCRYFLLVISRSFYSLFSAFKYFLKPVIVHGNYKRHPCFDHISVQFTFIVIFLKKAKQVSSVATELIFRGEITGYV